MVNVSYDYQVKSYYSGRVTDNDPYDTYRLVGYFEYGKALENFDKLLKVATSEELEAMDQIVKSAPEFTIYTNLSRQVRRQKTPLSENEQAGTRKKLGFPWIVALARVEFAAMMAGFSDTPMPFANAKPTTYDAAAYKALLLDGLRTHFWALTADTELLAALKNKSRSSRLLAYFRRALLAQKFAEGVGQLSGNDMTPEQKAQLVNWTQQLRSLKQSLGQSVGDRLDALTGVETSPVGSSSRKIKRTRRK